MFRIYNKNNKYITMLGINYTDNLGAQINNFAALYAISRHTGHRILFFEEYAKLGKTLRIHQCFKGLPFDLLPVSELPEEEHVHVVYPVTNDVVVDSRIFNLKPELNYNFIGGFHSYRYWYPLRNEISSMYRFDDLTVAQANDVISRARYNGRQVVSVHVRRDDYIGNNSHINLTLKYYNSAFSLFDDSAVNYLIFSDDITWCHKTFSQKNNIFFSESSSPIVDMCAISLCDHNIIANSTFSFWGAFLNRNRNKQVICPAMYLKSNKSCSFSDYAWYPDEFIGLAVDNE